MRSWHGTLQPVTERRSGSFFARGGLGLGLARGEVVEVIDQRLPHLVARHDGVDHTSIEQKLSGLEARRQLRLCGVLDHSRPGKADHRARLSDNQIPDAGVARHHAGGGRVREHADVWQAGLGMVGQRATGLGHLHQAEHPFVHSGRRRWWK